MQCWSMQSLTVTNAQHVFRLVIYYLQGSMRVYTTVYRVISAAFISSTQVAISSCSNSGLETDNKGAHHHGATRGQTALRVNAAAVTSSLKWRHVSLSVVQYSAPCVL